MNTTINLRFNSEVKEHAGMILDAMDLSFKEQANELRQNYARL